MKTIQGYWKNNRDLVLAVLYAVFVTALGAYLNYVMPYDLEPVVYPSLTMLVVWFLLYAPLFLFTRTVDWKLEDFGFSVNYRANVASVLVLAFCAVPAVAGMVPWRGALVEAYARTGEEVFFRGFLFLLALKLFHGKAQQVMWAVLISAAVFALVHTQTFQTSFFESSSMSRPFLIAQRLLNVFLFGAVFTLIRHWTGSILPGAIAHSLIQGGFLALFVCLVIYAGFVFWAHKRGEKVLSGLFSN